MSEDGYTCGLCGWHGSRIDEQAIRTPIRLVVMATGWHAVFDLTEKPIVPGYVCWRCGQSVKLD